jgi:hypothetical protein
MTAALGAATLIVIFILLRVSRRFIWPAVREMEWPPADHQFDLIADNPESRTIRRFLAIIAALSLVAAGVLFVVVSPFQAITPAAVLCPLALLGSWRFSRFFRGRAELGACGITIRAGRTVLLGWEHICAIEVTTFRRTRGSDAAFAALMGAGVDEPFVRVKLNRGMRFDTFGGLSGPDVNGLPTSIRQCRIWLANPHCFVEAAGPYLQGHAPSASDAKHVRAATSV